MLIEEHQYSVLLDALVQVIKIQINYPVVCFDLNDVNDYIREIKLENS